MHKPFDTFYEDYDKWFEKVGRDIFALEVKAIKRLSSYFSKPMIEVGIGSGRFGGNLNVEYGFDPSYPTIRIAKKRVKNLFVGIGKLIASLELNDQEGISNSLDYIDSALEQVGQMHADIGARLNRLKTSDSILADLQVNQMERKSFIEDVDFADLLTKISQQQTVYQTILKSASMIMKMSLVNYV
jgi:flagellar hook-associated protein 3 FlgL